MTGQQIVSDFQNYISQNGNIYREWYIGITGDIEKRLFGEHGVLRKGTQGFIDLLTPTRLHVRLKNIS